MKNYLLLILVFSFPSSFLLACFCGPIPTFCETITAGNNGVINDWNTIVEIEIIDKKTDGIDIKIESVLFGTLTEEELFIKRGSGSFCTIDTDLFSEGEFYIFNLYDMVITEGLYLSDCGIHFLKIENGNINGPIAPDVESISLDEFTSLECFQNMAVSISDVSPLESSLHVFPNPTDGNFSILNTKEIKANQLAEIELVDLQGRLIYKAQKTEGWLPNEEWRINVSEISDGIYFLKVFIEEKSSVIKIVKM